LIRGMPHDATPEGSIALANLYAGRFALDFAYEEWAAPYRDALHATYLRVMERAVRSDIDSGHFNRGTFLAERAAEVDPEAEEIQACRPYLQRQVELIEPRVICTLGNFATKLLSGSQEGITRVHGVPQQRQLGGREVTLYPLFHPAAALRTPRVKEQLSEDFARLPRLLAQEPAPAMPSEPEAGPTPATIEQMGLFGS